LDGFSLSGFLDLTFLERKELAQLMVHCGGIRLMIQGEIEEALALHE
jgi:hypothetical protein